MSRLEANLVVLSTLFFFFFGENKSPCPSSIHFLLAQARRLGKLARAQGLPLRKTGRVLPAGSQQGASRIKLDSRMPIFSFQKGNCFV